MCVCLSSSPLPVDFRFSRALNRRSTTPARLRPQSWSTVRRGASLERERERFEFFSAVWALTRPPRSLSRLAPVFIELTFPSSQGNVYTDSMSLIVNLALSLLSSPPCSQQSESVHSRSMARPSSSQTSFLAVSSGKAGATGERISRVFHSNRCTCPLQPPRPPVAEHQHGTALARPDARREHGITGVFRCVPPPPSRPAHAPPSVALDRGDGNGFYTFGGLDAAKAGVKESSCVAPPPHAPQADAPHSIVYTPVGNTRDFWMFASASARIAGTTVRTTSRRAPRLTRVRARRSRSRATRRSSTRARRSSSSRTRPPRRCMRRSPARAWTRSRAGGSTTRARRVSRLPDRRADVAADSGARQCPRWRWWWGRRCVRWSLRSVMWAAGWCLACVRPRRGVSLLWFGADDGGRAGPELRE